MDDLIREYSRSLIDTHQKGSTSMEPTAIKQGQDPELYMAIDLETMAKGGWKRTYKVSVRVFDGNVVQAEELISQLLDRAAHVTNEKLFTEETTNGPE